MTVQSQSIQTARFEARNFLNQLSAQDQFAENLINPPPDAMKKAMAHYETMQKVK